MADNLGGQLQYLIASVNRQFVSDLEDKLRPEGVPIDQFRVLAVMSEEDGLTMGELASRALIDATTLSRISDRMVKLGYIYRGPHAQDRRKVVVFLSNRGAALYKRLKAIQVEQERKFLNVIPADELKKLESILIQLQSTL